MHIIEHGVTMARQKSLGASYTELLNHYKGKIDSDVISISEWCVKIFVKHSENYTLLNYNFTSCKLELLLLQLCFLHICKKHNLWNSGNKALFVVFSRNRMDDLMSTTQFDMVTSDQE